MKRDPWRNGSASDSRSEGCVFDSRRVHFFKILGQTLGLFGASYLVGPIASFSFLGLFGA